MKNESTIPFEMVILGREFFVFQLPVIFPNDETDSKPKQPIKLKGQIKDMECLVLPSMGDLTFTLEITLPEGSHLTEDSPSRWVLLSGKYR